MNSELGLVNSELSLVSRHYFIVRLVTRHWSVVIIDFSIQCNYVIYFIAQSSEFNSNVYGGWVIL